MIHQKIDQAWHALIDRRLIEALDDTPLLRGCREGTVSPKELRSLLIQQFHYSRNFTRFLCALLSNMTVEEDLIRLAENLFEEMGLGAVGDTPHSLIYRQMLCDFGIDPLEEPPYPATTELVNTMLYYCRSHDPMDGLGALCLGAEAIVPHVYSQIINGFLSHGYSEESLVFFRIHIENDDDHAKTMKSIIDREIKGDRQKLLRLTHAATTIIEKRRRFFEEIHFRASDSFEGHFSRDMTADLNIQEPIYAI